MTKSNVLKAVCEGNHSLAVLARLFKVSDAKRSGHLRGMLTTLVSQGKLFTVANVIFRSTRFEEYPWN